MGRVDGFGAAPSFAAAWLAMMAAMMLPSALPALASARRRWLASTVTYLAIWELAGVVAYVAGRALFAHASTAELGIAFAAAGGYELSPLKRSCLARCRAAATTAGGSTGRYGWDCVGCSAGLMLALVAVGAMSLAWMVAIAAVLVVQKATAIGPRAPTATGMLLLALGAWAVLAASSVPSVILGD